MQFSTNINDMIKRILIALYILAIVGFSAAARADVSIYPVGDRGNISKLRTYQGEVVMTVDSKFYLVLEDETAFELRSEQDLTDFNGAIVEVSGFEVLKKRVGPVYSLMSLDPLSETQQVSMPDPILIVFKISGISQN